MLKLLDWGKFSKIYLKVLERVSKLAAFHPAVFFSSHFVYPLTNHTFSHYHFSNFKYSNTYMCSHAMVTKCCGSGVVVRVPRPSWRNVLRRMAQGHGHVLLPAWWVMSSSASALRKHGGKRLELCVVFHRATAFIKGRTLCKGSQDQKLSEQGKTRGLYREGKGQG